MSLIVQKYGGTSVANLDRIRHVAEHIAATKKLGHDLVIVVSAMGRQTDQLLDMAFALSPRPDERELDMLLTVGERISMSLLSIALNALGIGTVSLTGSQSGIITDTYHGNARIKTILGHRIQDNLQRGKVVIVAGFQGMSLPEKEVTTLGRGGSDLTAIALADRLQAEKCEIYKDVDGICTADPGLVQQAQLIHELGWEALTLLTWHGSGVVHSRGAHLAQKKRIPLEIRSSFNLHLSGTKVGALSSMESAVVQAISHDENLTFIEMNSSDQVQLCLINQWLWKRGTTPSLIQQVRAASWQLRLVLPEKQLADLEAEFLKENPNISLKILAKALASISIIGYGFWQEPEILDRALNILVTEPYFVDSQNTVITFLVDQNALQLNLVALHQKLILEAKV